MAFVFVRTFEVLKLTKYAVVPRGVSLVINPILNTPLPLPVLFEMGKGSGVFKMGFITKEDLSELDILDKVAIYTPLSYNLSGIMYLVNRDQVQVLNDVGAGEAMKFIMSGGVTELDDEHDHKSLKP